ncbi:uncharacterized protein B0I36DRAFT_360817 [Microdochium trichocladiopsis]|uniref:Uncharacterized protein n=1 Tax=Microdochium trichocladiopsis TaxID=1682393 RepID=A0A9P9BT16_9PEZI|nr:uncharacterized protein B0I36DRAFT_360817 [Microdochium trichocladiopsis]KAH7035460.1 hypothetical protein B0I36DRAFT_360817 [Microdochium trichocladiopsis]
MGCAESREVDSASMKSFSSSRHPEASPLMPGHGFSESSSSPQGATTRFVAQHERLVLELLPFKDAAKFSDWLQSVYVVGAWREFCRDFLADNPHSVEPDKTRTAQLARDAIKSNDPKYLLYHPDKTEWTDMDHHVRFIVVVIQDNLLKKLWSKDDTRSSNLDVPKAVYEVLVFLRATLLNPASSPPRYED